MMFDNPDYFTIEQLKPLGIWPYGFLSAYGMIPYLKRAGENIVGIEVGVLKGENAYVLFENLPNIGFISGIDNYKPHTDYDTVRSQEDMDNYLRIAKENLADYDNKFDFIVKDFRDAAEDFNKESVDFVLLDAEHTYDGMMEQLNLYYPLIRKGGYVFIHDTHMEDVKNAVMDFRRDNKIRIPLHMSKNNLMFWQR